MTNAIKQYIIVIFTVFVSNGSFGLNKTLLHFKSSGRSLDVGIQGFKKRCLVYLRDNTAGTI